MVVVETSSLTTTSFKKNKKQNTLMSSLLSYMDKNVEYKRRLIKALHMITILTRANSRIRKALK